MISTHNLSQLPDIDTLKHHLQSLAILDAILSPEWEYRYYSFDAKWGNDEMLGSMKNGSGDHFLVLFSPSGCIIKGFDHESSMSPFRLSPPAVWPGILESVPSALGSYLQDESFITEETTFCIWQCLMDQDWHIGEIDFPEAEDPDGSGKLLSILNGIPQMYASWASDYHEVALSIEVINHIYQFQPLTQTFLERISPAVSTISILEEASEIGYPTQLMR